MKLSRMAVHLAIAICAVTIVAVAADYPVAVASVFHDVRHLDFTEIAGLVLAVGLEPLRAQHQELTTRAAARLAEVKDGMSAEEVRVIETDHAALLRDVSTVAGAITIEERRVTPPATGPVDPNAAATAAVEAERARTAEITEAAQRHNMPASFAQGHITAGTAVAEVRRLVLEHVAAESAKQRISPIQIGTDAHETARNAVEAAIMLRANPQSIRPDTEPNRVLIAAARNFRGMSLLEIGRVYVEDLTGQRMRGHSKMELAGHLLGLNGTLGAQRDGAGMMSTSDFPNILANVINKRLRSAYEVAPQNWKQISRQSNAPDFKTKYVVQLSNLPKLKEVKEGGEYTYASLTDGKETYSLVTYGRIVPVTRQTLINDDLGAFDRIPMLMGRAAAETEASIVWGIITTNGAMSDGVALFHANHGNLAAAGAAITVASLNAGRAAMRKQKGLAVKAAEQEPLNLAPKFIAVSPDKETEAQSFLASIYATKAGDVNPFAQSLLQLTEARLTGNTWYLFADPALIDTIEFAYLEGEEGLYTETRFGFDVDGLEVKGRLDFAAKAIDWRGMYKDPGA